MKGFGGFGNSPLNQNISSSRDQHDRGTIVTSTSDPIEEEWKRGGKKVTTTSSSYDYSDVDDDSNRRDAHNPYRSQNRTVNYYNKKGRLVKTEKFDGTGGYKTHGIVTKYNKKNEVKSRGVLKGERQGILSDQQFHEHRIALNKEYQNYYNAYPDKTQLTEWQIYDENSQIYKQFED